MAKVISDGIGAFYQHYPRYEVYVTTSPDMARSLDREVCGKAKGGL